MTQIVQHFVNELMDDGEFIIHTKLLESEPVQELEEALEAESFWRVKEFYKDLPSMIDYDALDEISDLLVEIETEKITEDDRAVLQFFAEDAKRGRFESFMMVSGVLVQISEIVEEMEEYSNSIIWRRLFPLPRNVEVSAYLWVYLNLYEVILDNMTQCLYKHLQAQGKQVDKIERRLENGEHLMAGEIENKLEEIGAIKPSNNSILSAERSRLIRNKIGHANIYYDSAENEFVFTNGERYSFEAFEEEYEVLLEFVTEWAFYLNDGEENLSKTMEEYFRRISNKIERDLIRIERGGHRREFNKFIQKIKTEEVRE